MKILLLALSLLSLPAHAQEIDRTLSICYPYQVMPAPKPAQQSPKCAVFGKTMYIDGEILPGHYEFELKSMYPEVDTLELNSDGGRILEINALADLIRQRGIRTHVRKGAVCKSACTLLYMAGTKRTAHPSAIFMFHGVRNGGMHANLDQFCKDHLFESCGKALIEYAEELKQDTVNLFEKYISLGAAPSLWADYLKLPIDENWYEEGNFTRRINWYMPAAETIKYNVVQEIQE